ncbi:hypothetical protein FB451DRAFT_1138102 [Mycena latifolia]|nr:hypothetical protein FB451DRAFT_1138102 [Mycena latifolia]
MHIEPAFPVELEREIFETAARLHPSVIPTLLRVARRTLVWIEPLLYRVVCVGRTVPDQGHNILNATKWKPASFFHDTVRHLLLDPATSLTVEEATEVLKLCTGVVNFAVVGSLSSPALLPVLGNMRVQRLSVSLNSLFGAISSVDPRHPLFAYITHLDILDPDPATSAPHFSTHIPALPSLTHLCLNNFMPWNVIRTLLAECPRLELLANFWAERKYDVAFGRAQNVPVHDVRFVMGLYGNYWADWEAGARGFPDFWSAADDFVAQKRSGAIAADFYWLEDAPRTASLDM